MITSINLSAKCFLWNTVKRRVNRNKEQTVILRSCPSDYKGPRCQEISPVHISTTISPSTKQDSCEPLTIPLCRSLPYNTTIFPNFLNHTTQDEAALYVHQFYPLVKVGCSEHISLFLCAVYAPVCTVLGSAVPPCRSLCNSARLGCEDVMKRFGVKWPESLNCERFPELGSEICVGLNETLEPTSQPPTGEKCKYCFTCLIVAQSFVFVRSSKSLF